VSEVSPGHLKLKFQRLLKKFFYWTPTKQLYGPPYIDIAIRLDELGIGPGNLDRVFWNLDGCDIFGVYCQAGHTGPKVKIASG
jgi:hypothetical protein